MRYRCCFSVNVDIYVITPIVAIILYDVPAGHIAIEPNFLPPRIRQIANIFRKKISIRIPLIAIQRPITSYVQPCGNPLAKVAACSS